MKYKFFNDRKLTIEEEIEDYAGWLLLNLKNEEDDKKKKLIIYYALKELLQVKMLQLRSDIKQEMLDTINRIYDKDLTIGKASYDWIDLINEEGEEDVE